METVKDLDIDKEIEGQLEQLGYETASLLSNYEQAIEIVNSLFNLVVFMRDGHMPLNEDLAISTMQKAAIFIDGIGEKEE